MDGNLYKVVCMLMEGKKLRGSLYKNYGGNLYKLMRMLVDGDREVE